MGRSISSLIMFSFPQALVNRDGDTENYAPDQKRALSPVVRAIDDAAVDLLSYCALSLRLLSVVAMIPRITLLTKKELCPRWCVQ